MSPGHYFNLIVAPFNRDKFTNVTETVVDETVMCRPKNKYVLELWNIAYVYLLGDNTSVTYPDVIVLLSILSIYKNQLYSVLNNNLNLNGGT